MVNIVNNNHFVDQREQAQIRNALKDGNNAVSSLEDAFDFALGNLKEHPDLQGVMVPKRTVSSSQ